MEFVNVIVDISHEKLTGFFSTGYPRNWGEGSRLACR